jgi:uncharacterized protein
MQATHAFTVAARGAELAATLTLPAGPGPHPAVVVLHAANAGTRSAPFYVHLTEHLPAQGIAAVLYDRRGEGESASSAEGVGFDQLADDGATVVDALAAYPGVDPARIALYGVSQGGWLAPMIAARRAVAALVIVSGCGVSPAAQMSYGGAYALREAGYGDGVIARAISLRARVDDYYRSLASRDIVQAEVEAARGEPWFPLAYLPMAGHLPVDVRQDEWSLELDHNPLTAWPRVDASTLFLFAADDRWVPVEESVAAFRAATSHLRTTFARIPGTDHLMRPTDAADPHDVSPEYLALLTTWLAERLGT